MPCLNGPSGLTKIISVRLQNISLAQPLGQKGRTLSV